MRAPWTEWALLLLLALLWGGAFVFIKIAVETMGSMTLVAVRSAIAALLLGGLAVAQGHRFAGLSHELPLYLRQASLQNVLPFFLIGLGVPFIPAGQAGILNATSPLMVFLMTLLWTRAEPATPRRALGLAFGFAGVVVIIGLEALGGLGQSLLAQGAILLATLCYALSAIFGARFSAPPLVVAATTSLVAFAISLPLALVLEQPWEQVWSARSLGAAIIIGLFANGLGMLIFFRLLRTLGPISTSSGGYLRAACAVMLGAMILGEPVTVTMLAGFGLILTGLLLVGAQAAYAQRSVRTNQ